MNFHWMEVYLSVLDTGSFAAAARREYMTQPAVSMAISSLEQELNRKLIYRHAGQRGGIQPTPEGQVFAEYARKTLAEYERMKDSFIIETEGKPLIIGASPTPVSSVLPGLLSSYRSTRPQCQIQVKAFRGKELRQRLLNGEVDCIVTGIDSMMQDERLQEEVFFRDPMVLICAPALHASGSVTVNQLKKLPLIIRNTDCFTMELLIRQLAELHVGLDDLNVILQVYGNMDVIHQVAAGYGAGFVVRSSLDMLDSLESFQILSVRGLKLFRDLRLVYPAGKEMLPMLQSFIRYAKSIDWREGKYTFNTLPDVMESEVRIKRDRGRQKDR